MNNWINKPTHIPLNKYHYTSIYQSTISGDGLYGIHVVSIKQAHSAHPAPQSHAQPWWLERKLWRRNSSQFRFVLSSSFFSILMIYVHPISISYCFLWMFYGFNFFILFLAFPSLLSLDPGSLGPGGIAHRSTARISPRLVNQQGFNLDVFYHGEMVTGWWCNVPMVLLWLIVFYSGYILVINTWSNESYIWLVVQCAHLEKLWSSSMGRMTSHIWNAKIKKKNNFVSWD